MAINATNSSCMQTIYDFHNRGVGYLGNSDSCISKILTIDPNDCIVTRVARLALIFFTGIVHVLGRLFGWCSGDAATYQSEIAPLNTSTPTPRSTVEGTANATNQSSSLVLGTSAPEQLDQTFDGEPCLPRSPSGESTLNSDETLPSLSSPEEALRAEAPATETPVEGSQNPQANLGSQESDVLELDVSSNSPRETPPSPSGSQSLVKPEEQAQIPATLSPTGSSILTSPEVGSHIFVPPTNEFVPVLPDSTLPPLTLENASDVHGPVTITESGTITITNADGTTTESSMTETARSLDPTTSELKADAAPITTLSMEGGTETKEGKTTETSERIPVTKPPENASRWDKFVSWILDEPSTPQVEKPKPKKAVKQISSGYSRGNRRV